MTIKNFVKEYTNKIDKIKEQYLSASVKITTYVPFVEKVTYATNLAQNTIVDKETGNVKVNSESNHLFFVRSIIELYTDLEIEDKSFYEEYDLLNESGVLDQIMQMIPEKEISEFKLLCDMKKSDIIQNKCNTQAFISSQIERFSMLTNAVLSPILNAISEKLDNISDEEAKNITDNLSDTVVDFLEINK